MTPNSIPESTRLANIVREMGRGSEPDNKKSLQEFEEDLSDAGFQLASMEDVARMMNDQRLYCRSESFSRLMELLLDAQPRVIENRKDSANMCAMASGAGFRTAMLEGFSGEDVGGMVKAVVTFSGEHLESARPIEKDSDLWRTKKETAEVSLRGRGKIFPGDVRMVSFRFPIRVFPKELLSEMERDVFDDERLAFVVRHYVR